MSFVANGLSDPFGRHQNVTCGLTDPAQSLRHPDRGGIGLDRYMDWRRRPRLGATSTLWPEDQGQTRPLGSSTPFADQPVTVENALDFHGAGGHRHCLWGQLVKPGAAHATALDLARARRSRRWRTTGTTTFSASAGAFPRSSPSVLLSTTPRSRLNDGHAARAAATTRARRHLRLHLDRLPDVDRHVGLIAASVPDHGKQAAQASTPSRFRRRRHCADRVWCVWPSSPLLGV